MPEDERLDAGVVSGDSGLAVWSAVANPTCSENRWVESTGASYDQSVSAQLWYGSYDTDEHRELIVQFRVEHQDDGVALVIAKVTSGQDSVESTSRVHFDPPDAGLVAVDGSGVWRHNTTPAPASPVYVDTPIADLEVDEPYLLARVAPGEGGVGTVTMQFRVVVDGFATYAPELLDPTTDEWSTRAEVAPGEVVDVRTTVANGGNGPLRQANARLVLPTGLTYVDDTLMLTDEIRFDDPAPSPEPSPAIDSTLISSGVELGDFAVGSSRIVHLRLRVDPGIAVGTELRVRLVVGWLGGSELPGDAVVSVR